MRVLVALGGNALLKRGEPMTAEIQRANIRVAATSLAPVAGRPPARAVPRQRPAGRPARAAGGGLQGRRAISARRARRPDRGDDRLPDRAGARQPAPAEVPFATILTMIEVDPDDPAFDDPTKFVGPDLRRRRGRARSPPRRAGCSSATATSLRRVVPSPPPKRIFEIRPIRWLLEHGVVVICAGGGGIPTTWVPGTERTLGGVEAVIDKDLASELLAREIDADLFVMATDVDGVYEGWGTPQRSAARAGDAEELRCDGLRGRVDGAEGRRRRPVRRGDRQARRHRLARATSSRSSAGRGRHDRRDRGDARGTVMAEFGVHSEVGKLRKVMVHRPDLSLQRLTPTNHDELLFDDVLWVERAQYEHDQFVARMRERGVEVFLLSDLLAEALAASDEARARLIELVASEYTVGWSLVDEIRELLGGLEPGAARQAPDRRPDRRRGRPRPGARPPRSSLIGAALDDPSDVRAAPAAEHAVHPRLVVLDLRRGVGQPDVLAGPPARGLQRRGDLPGPPDVRRRRLRVLVPARGRRRPVRDRRLRPGVARGRRRACRSATAPC